MRCSACGFDNRELAKFCGGCGVLLALRCSQCGADISSHSKFCDRCGANISSKAASPIDGTDETSGVRAPTVDIKAEIAANRRQMSLLSCDLAESSILARSLDPEDLRYAINNFHQISREIIEKYEGYYAQYMGDGFMAYFSYPIAHEDDAHRAVLAGLRIIEAIRHFNVDLKSKHGIELHLRVGVNTGQVIVDEFVVGEPPNIAARVQAAARPDTVVITETTKRLLPVSEFSYQDLGVHELKNVGTLRLFRVVERQEVNGSAIKTRIIRPLIGRRKQLGLLSDHWELVKEGVGQAVIIAGEAGIGKSKLVEGFEAQFGPEAHAILRFQGSPFHKNTMLYPVIDRIQRAAKILRSDSNDEKVEKLNVFLRQFENSDRILPLISRLLSISEETSAQHLSPQRLLQQTLEAVIQIAFQYASKGATLFIFEDIHWLDSTTMSLLDAFIPLIRNQRVLLLLTTRSSFTPELQKQFYLTQIALPRLRPNEVDDLIESIINDRTLRHSVHAQILNKANGMPLYVEELTKMVIDAEVMEAKSQQHPVAASDLTIPLTLRDPLTSRVDRVKGRRVLQLAATLGKEFDYELLSAVSSLEGEVLVRELRHLVAAELLYQKGPVLQEASFEFRHSLIRDAAYELLTKAEREIYHKKAGRILEERFPETVRTHPELIAYHYTQARSYGKAVHYWYEAGKQSAARSAHNEAVGHLTQALELIPNIDDPVVRNKSELLLQTSLGNSLRATRGWSADDVKQAYTRAYELCRESGFDEPILPAVFGLWTWNFVRPALSEAETLAKHLLKTAETADDPNCMLLGQEALGFTLFARGEFAAAHAALESSIRMAGDNEAASACLDLSAQDPRVHVRLYDGMVLWFLGHPDRALRLCSEARLHADALRHPFSEAMARTISLRVHQFRGDAGAVATQADAAIALCREHEFVHYRAMALILRGWATAQQGDFEKGIAEIQQGLEIERATGALLYESYTLGLLADACIKNERYGQAFDFLSQAQLGLEEENSARFYASEIYRLLGEAYWQSQRDVDQAEHYFSKGLEVAGEQGAKSLQLRICISAYDLHEAMHSPGDYRAQLAKIYGSFSEGFDTCDLLQAKSRLTASSAGEAGTVEAGSF